MSSSMWNNNLLTIIRPSSHHDQSMSNMKPWTKSITIIQTNNKYRLKIRVIVVISLTIEQISTWVFILFRQSSYNGRSNHPFSPIKSSLFWFGGNKWILLSNSNNFRCLEWIIHIEYQITYVWSTMKDEFNNWN